MNEHIQKLSNIWANRRELDEQLGITYTFSEKALEKFAELIVRECIRIDIENPDAKPGIEIARHFGVEL